MQTCRPGPQVYEFRRVQMSKYRICTLWLRKNAGEKMDLVWIFVFTRVQ